MNYEKEFRDFYNKYSKLYANNTSQSPYYNDPSYFNYIVQSHKQYKEPFIPASRFNIDRLTEKIGYEKPERFPYLEFRQITPYSKPNENQSRIPSQSNAIIFPQSKYHLYSPSMKPPYDESRYYNEGRRNKQERKINCELFPQHIIDFSAHPQQMTYNEEVPFQNYLYESSPDYYQYKGLSPIKSNIVNKHVLSVNPYTEKIGGYGPTQLMNNPIIYPLNTFKNITKRMYCPTPFGSVGGAIIQS